MKPINFLKQESTKDKLIKHKILIASVIICLMIVSIILFDYILLKQKINILEKTLAQNENIVTNKSDQGTEQYTTNIEHNNLIEIKDKFLNYNKSNTYLKEIFLCLIEESNDSIFITSLEYDYPTVIINGKSNSEALINELLNNLSKSDKLFIINSINYSDNAYSFSIEGEL